MIVHRSASTRLRSGARYVVGLTLLLGAVAVLDSKTRAAGAAKVAPEESWIASASVGLDPRPVDALRQIEGTDRRLLALRAYLRAGPSLAERWSWSQEQLSAYPASVEGKNASAEIDAVIAAFASANPGFTLHVNREPRSLELQIAHWNENESVGRTAAELAAALKRKFAGDDQLATPAAVRSALMEWKPSSAAALAAPGLSPHGQARAFDFQVERGGQIIAGTEFAFAAGRWDAAGWTEKLRAAVSAAGGHFTGPLRSPYEPWHYAYVPGATKLGPATR